MTPFLTTEQFTAGESICKTLMPQLQKLDAKSCIVGLAMCLVFAADATDTPQESVFQFMRELRKAFQVANKALEDAPASKIIVP